MPCGFFLLRRGPLWSACCSLPLWARRWTGWLRFGRNRTRALPRDARRLRRLPHTQAVHARRPGPGLQPAPGRAPGRGGASAGTAGCNRSRRLGGTRHLGPDGLGRPLGRDLRGQSHARPHGLAPWTPALFIQTMRSGKHLGAGRPILPPMPWAGIGQLTDEDLRAVFAYLRTLKPVHNAVPAPLPFPAGMARPGMARQ